MRRASIRKNASRCRPDPARRTPSEHWPSELPSASSVMGDHPGDRRRPMWCHSARRLPTAKCTTSCWSCGNITAGMQTVRWPCAERWSASGLAPSSRCPPNACAELGLPSTGGARLYRHVEALRTCVRGSYDWRSEPPRYASGASEGGPYVGSLDGPVGFYRWPLADSSGYCPQAEAQT